MKKQFTFNEEAVWEQLRTGDKHAFGLLYEKYSSLLFNYCNHFCTDRELIKDCLHDLFVELWRNHKTLGPTTSVRFYLMASAKRKIVRYLEQELRFIKKHEDYLLYHSGREDSYEIQLIDEEDHNCRSTELQLAIDSLTRRQKQVIELKYFHNLSTDEIAGLMKINTQSVYNLIFGALKLLKKQLLSPQIETTLIVAKIP